MNPEVDFTIANVKSGGRIYYECIREGYSLYSASSGNIVTHTTCSGELFDPPINDLVCRGIEHRLEIIYWASFMEKKLNCKWLLKSVVLVLVKNLLVCIFTWQLDYYMKRFVTSLCHIWRVVWCCVLTRHLALCLTRHVTLCFLSLYRWHGSYICRLSWNYWRIQILGLLRSPVRSGPILRIRVPSCGR